MSTPRTASPNDIQRTETIEAYRSIVAQWSNIDGPATSLKLPRAISRGAAAAVAWALHLADDTGCVELTALRDALGVTDASSTRRILGELERLGLARRLVTSRPLKMRLVYSAIFKGDKWQTCQHCPHPVVTGVAKPRYCATCMATIVRHDRTWRAHAFEVWASSRGTTEAAVIYKIHAQTNQPLFTRKGVKDSVETPKEGIVNWMLHTGLIVDETYWRQRVRAYNDGDEGEE
jgi:hypothetical protein